MKTRTLLQRLVVCALLTLALTGCGAGHRVEFRHGGTGEPVVNAPVLAVCAKSSAALTPLSQLSPDHKELKTQTYDKGQAWFVVPHGYALHHIFLKVDDTLYYTEKVKDGARYIWYPMLTESEWRRLPPGAIPGAGRDIKAMPDRPAVTILEK